MVTTGSFTTRNPEACLSITTDGAGTAQAFSVGNEDFNYRSLRGNAVLRWEWSPGSTLFLVWQQDRAGRLGAPDLAGREAGSFDIRQNLDDLWSTRPVNVLVIKASYWLNP